MQKAVEKQKQRCFEIGFNNHLPHYQHKSRKKARVTVILLTFNHEKFIEHSIKLILNQTYQEIDLVVVDNKSSDDTVSIVKNLLDAGYNFQLIRIGRRKGISQAVNFALKHVKSEYFKIVSGDDYIQKSTVEKQLDMLQKNVEASFCYTDMHWTWQLPFGMSFKLGHYSALQNRRDDIQSLIDDSTMAIPTILYRSSKVRNIKFPDEFECIGDWVFVLRCLERGPAVYLDYVSMNYNRHFANSSKTNSYHADRDLFAKKAQKEGGEFSRFDLRQFNKLREFSKYKELLKIKDFSKCFRHALSLTTYIFKSKKWFWRVLFIWFSFGNRLLFFWR